MNGSIEIIAGIVRSSLEIPLSILACKVRIGPKAKAVLMLCLGPSPSRMFGWLFNNTKGSVLMTLIAHAADGLVITGNLGLNAINSERQIMLLVATYTRVPPNQRVVRSWRKGAVTGCLGGRPLSPRYHRAADQRKPPCPTLLIPRLDRNRTVVLVALRFPYTHCA
ncbi:hypothetical protein [Ensifer sp. 22564]|uniref:hypothetical protein n=1 Tax=Ensifer sp. 22564 TaxID=3453943 RepID=UPI003F87DD3E